MTNKNCEILIIGAGITGLTIARELVERGYENILIIEKESRVGIHASGRNSGVLHSGVYYSPGSLKAKYCVEGNRLMRDYCELKNLPIQKTGKVIVATDEEKHKNLFELKSRADKAGANTRIIDEKELKELEPHAFTLQQALYCPDTAVINPVAILNSLEVDLLAIKKMQIDYNTFFTNVSSGNAVNTNKGEIKYKKVINAAGAFAEKIAHSFGLARQYCLIPFKGTYKQLGKKSSHLVNGNIYPVPDLNNPFLGVHFTRCIDGMVYAGPTAIPALSRENYGLTENLGRETLKILFQDGVLALLNESFRNAAINEVKKYFDGYFYEEARLILPELKPGDLERSQKTGIRPQLVHWPDKKLVMDFVVLKKGDSMHLLNSISPGFTTSMAFSKHVVDEMERVS